MGARCLPEQISASAKNRDVPDFASAPDTIRTCDLCLRRAAEKSLLARIEISLSTAFPALSPHNIGFAREHRAPRQRGRVWITIQDPADEIGRQPGKMDQVADIVVGDVFTYRNFRH
jgi:hypothetical protein